MINPQQETQQREKEQQALKEKQNRKEFRKWNRLHRNNKYRSMVSRTSMSACACHMIDGSMEG